MQAGKKVALQLIVPKITQNLCVCTCPQAQTAGVKPAAGASKSQPDSLSLFSLKAISTSCPTDLGVQCTACKGPS